MTTTTVPSDIVVHVAGAVAMPGVHRLPVGARVMDAVVAAGGPAPDAHLDAVNLAAPLADGDRVNVPTVADAVEVPAGVTNAPASAGSSDGGATSGPVPINTATAEQLDALPGIGPATAAAIVAHREQHGPFISVEALADVRGIGPAKLEAIRPMVTL
jgi:competence protein ComEA